MQPTAKVLLVEDEIPLLDMYEKKLTIEGFDVRTAGDGLQALEVLKDYTPDVMLLDVMMPNMDGIEVLKALRENEKTKDMRIIMLTNLGNESTAEQIYKYGADDYIVKAEMTPSQVVTRIKEILAL